MIKVFNMKALTGGIFRSGRSANPPNSGTLHQCIRLWCTFTGWRLFISAPNRHCNKFSEATFHSWCFLLLLVTFLIVKSMKSELRMATLLKRNWWQKYFLELKQRNSMDLALWGSTLAAHLNHRFCFLTLFLPLLSRPRTQGQVLPACQVSVTSTTNKQHKLTQLGNCTITSGQVANLLEFKGNNSTSFLRAKISASGSEPEMVGSSRKPECWVQHCRCY